jgi:hypothetical protein
MVQILKLISHWWNGEKKVSESANRIGCVFDDNSENKVFWDLVFNLFESYDESNRNRHNENFCNDIDFIIDCTTSSMKSPEHLKLFPQRVDAYFYIYCRTAEYNSWERKSIDQMKNLQKGFAEQLSNVFKSTNGSEPYLRVLDKDLIKRMKIRQHLTPITEIKDEQTLNIFFVLCKLSFQSSLLVDDHGRLQWIDVLPSINQWKIPLKYFITKYIEYKLAFEQHPIDLPALIHLVWKIHPPKDVQLSPFEVFNDMLCQLNLDQMTFFATYRAMFDQKMRDKFYEFSHVGALLRMLDLCDGLFGDYLSIYVSHVPNHDLWRMFLYISKNGDINDIIQKHFSLILSQRMNGISFEAFKEHYQSTKQSLEALKDENQTRFLQILEQVVSAFLNKQLHEERYSYNYTDAKLKELLNIVLELSPTHSLQHPSCSLIIHHLLFKSDKHATNKFYKIKYLFERLNGFDQNLCETHDPVNIIRDEWLNDYILYIPHDWFKLSKHDYQSLCNIHHNNRWSICIWSKLVNLSFLKSEIAKPNEMLIRLNEWMNHVGHNIYDATDTLTIIFVKNILEIVINKHIKFVLSLSSMESIVQYILRMREEMSYLIDTKLVDDFVENIKQSIKNITLLNSKAIVTRVPSI